MGARIVKGFEIAMQEGGMKAQMRLAMKAGLSSDKAASAADSPELIAKMEKALQEILGKSIKL